MLLNNVARTSDIVETRLYKRVGLRLQRQIILFFCILPIEISIIKYKRKRGHLMKIKKVILVILSAVMFFTCSVPASASLSKITKEEAKLIAIYNANLKSSQVTALKVKRDGKCYVVEFKKKSNGAEYEYDILINSGRIQEKEIEYRHERNTSKKRISKSAAYKAVSKASGRLLSVVKNGTIKYRKDEGEWIYEIKFTRGYCTYTFDVLAPTGKVIEVNKKYDLA